MNVTVHEAKTQLSRLLRRVAAGEEVIILHRDRPVAKLVAFTRKRPRDLRADLKGRVRIAKDFDETPADFEDYA
ncbi:MAG: type II toxin-antitoxin system Phd/YefM family antitoxin [Deltaproteobacteria bacterium]|nr:type II toxin-antitoxin system Phd/YefM family antitoxin [Deltaproteobacteria bacterium]